MMDLSDVDRELTARRDLSGYGIRVSPAGADPVLAAILLGLLDGRTEAGALETAYALELMDAAVFVHYYAEGDDSAERLITGDHWYALAMREIATLGRNDVVGALSEATADVARGHTLPADDPQSLGLRSALFPASVRLAALLGGFEPAAAIGEFVALMGRCREAGLAGVSLAPPRMLPAAAASMEPARSFGPFTSDVVRFARTYTRCASDTSD